jgi:phosphatidylglycerol:prolipoprotein diacylglycerol transferase
MLSGLLLSFPAIDPVLIQLGPLAVRWYSLAYIAGVLGGYWWVGRVDGRGGKPLLSAAQREDVVVWAIVGIVLGGRIGYVLFYNLSYYLAHPVHILSLWEGGMSFHGGLIGVIVSFALFARKHGLPFVTLMDRIACAAPIGLFFGRLANFVNGELYGRASDVAWAMVFPRGGEMPRHPSQLYEAAAEGLVLFLVLACLATRTKALQRPGVVCGVFMAGYGLARFLIEYAREPDAQLGLFFSFISMGQILCLPMIALGAWLMLTSKQRVVADVPA